MRVIIAEIEKLTDPEIAIVMNEVNGKTRMPTKVAAWMEFETDIKPSANFSFAFTECSLSFNYISLIN